MQQQQQQLKWPEHVDVTQQQQQQQQLKWPEHVDVFGARELSESRGGRRSLISFMVSLDVKQQTVDVLSFVSQPIGHTFLSLDFDFGYLGGMTYLISIPWEWSVYIMFCGTFPLSNKRHV